MYLRRMREMSYKDMKVAFFEMMPPSVRNTFLADLDNFGFILTAKQVFALNYFRVGITYLGLKYVEFEDTDN